MANKCPKCGQDNRPGSRFCAVCGGPIAGPANAGTGVQASAAVPPAAVGPVVAKAGAAIAPVAKQAAAKGWAGSKRGVGFLARVFTIGGRAAYSEVFGSLPTASGQVAAPPNEAAVAEPIETAALVFVLALLGGWLAFTLPPRGTAIVIIAAPLVLLVLSWLGFRRPYFTKMTFTGLAGRMRNRGRARQVPIYKFQVYEQTTGQPLDVVMVGPRQGSALGSGRECASLGYPSSGPERAEILARGGCGRNRKTAGLADGAEADPADSGLVPAVDPVVAGLAHHVVRLIDAVPDE